MTTYFALAAEIVSRCRILALYSEEEGLLKRTFLSQPMHAVHTEVGRWMRSAGMDVRLDHVGSIRGCYPGSNAGNARLILGSHLDTVPNAGAFDGRLGVLLAIGCVELLAGRRLKFPIEVIGFSDEEGVRFGVPFIGSRALIGEVDGDLLARRDVRGISVAEAMREYGLDPARITEASLSGDVLTYLEMHIEQGPVLETLGYPLGVRPCLAKKSGAESTSC